MRARAIQLIVMIFALAFIQARAVADDFVVIYIENDGRFIELYENKVDELYGPEGSLMAIDGPEILTGENRERIAPEDEIVRWWKNDGDDWIIVYFKETKSEKRFPRSALQIITVDRPWGHDPEIPVEQASV